jgi:Tfp pilus assembly protein PilO
MTSYLDKLNLRPFEKRLVVGVAVVLFAVFNFWFVFPHFSDLGQAQARKAEAMKKLERWQAECAKLPQYRAAIASIVGESAEVALENQHNQFTSVFLNQGAQSGVNINETRTANPRTNDFFLELASTISAQSSEPQLVDFLYNLGAGTNMIRVRSLSLSPDQPHQRLMVNATLVASFPKNPPKKAAPAVQAAATKPAAPAAKQP